MERLLIDLWMVGALGAIIAGEPRVPFAARCMIGVAFGPLGLLLLWPDRCAFAAPGDSSSSARVEP
ncbi:MAG: hypothetical protein AAGD18_24525 [Actinomycetota bacterium]